MSHSNDFDCIKMKEEIQEKMREEFKDLSDEEIRNRIQMELQESDDPIAEKWRKIQLVETSSK